MDSIKIVISGDASALEPTLNKLKQVGLISDENKAKVTAAGEAHTKAMKETGDEAGRLETKMRSLAERIAAAFAVERIFEFAKESVKAFQDAQLAAEQLSFAITKIGGESTTAFKKLVEQAEKLSKVTVFSKTTLIAGQKQLANFGLQSKEIQKLLPQIIDMASATGKDLPEAIEKSILAINGQTKGLRDVGIGFKDTGDKAKNLALLEKDLSKFTGEAGDALETSSGQAKMLTNQMEELEIAIGARLEGTFQKTKVVLMQGLDELVNNFSSFGRAINNLTDDFGDDGLTGAQARFLIQNGFVKKQIQYTDEDIKKAKGILQYSDNLDKKTESLSKNGASVKAYQLEIIALTKEQKLLNHENDDGLVKFNLINQTIIKLGETIKDLEGKDVASKLGLTLKGEADAEAAAKKIAEAAKKAYEKALAERESFTQKLIDAQKKDFEKLELDQAVNDQEKLLIKKSYAAEELKADYEKSTKSIEALNALNSALLEIERSYDIEKAKLDEKDWEDAQKEADKRTNEETRLVKIDLQKRKQAQQDANDEFNLKMQIDLKTQLNSEKITQEEYDKADLKRQLDFLEVKKSQLEVGSKEYLEIQNEELDLQMKTQEKADKKLQESVQKTVDSFKQMSSAAIQEYQNILTANISYIDHKEQLTKDSIDQQTQLAIAGKANTLAFEKKNLADQEKLRIENQKKLKKAKELEIFLNSLASFSKDDPKSALGKALALMAVTIGAEATFAEEGGLVGQIKDKSWQGRKHKGGGDVLVHAQTGEGILSRNDISNMGGEQAFLNFKSMLNTGLPPIPMSGVMFQPMDTKRLEDKLDNLERTMANKKEVSVDFESMREMLAMNVTTTEKGVIETVKHELKRRTIRG